MTIYFAAGEVSADNHGAALMHSLRELRPGLKFIGRGGPRMQQIAGAQFRDWIGEAAVLGLWEVLRKYGYFREQFHQTLGEISASKPDAVVLIDYPGFNLRLARALRQQSQNQKTIYYISPQVWAWNRGRIKKMARLIDLMVFFPGSRLREVRKIFPVMIEAARLLLRTRLGLRFRVAAASEDLAREMSEMLRSGQPDIRQAIEIVLGQTPALMQQAWAGIVASGSATLEAAYFRMPFVLIYKVAWPTYLAARAVVNVNYLGMPNLLADKEVVPEFIQQQVKPGAIATAMCGLIDDVDAREQMISEFDAIITQLGGGGASEHAAQAILEEIGVGCA